MTITKEQAIKLFHELHPYYDIEHVQEIADINESELVPFCTECKDWHLTYEQHTMCVHE